MVEVARLLGDAGWTLYATAGARGALAAAGLESILTHRVGQGSPDCSSLIESGVLKLVVNTPSSARDVADSAIILQNSAS